MRIATTILSILCASTITAQHNNEFYNDGALVHVQAGAEVHVLGDVHMRQGSGTLHNDGFIKMQGNAYSDNLFQQRGTGTFLVQNSDVNTGERQFISGSYAVRGGQGQIGVNDGSFYNLELGNDQGIVYLIADGSSNVGGQNYVADVRGAVDFNVVAAPNNRVITRDVGLTGAIPFANGSGHNAIFGMMNPTAGGANFLDESVDLGGNMSVLDYGYVEGKLRRAVSAAGGVYGYYVGLEPAGAGAQKGFQYAHLNFGVNNYDVISGYFETGSPNAFAVQLECTGETMDYFGGVDHGEWMFDDITGAGAGLYEIQIWPQDDNFIAAPIWAITKDNSFQGTVNDCGPSPVGLTRAGLSGFSEFSVAAPVSALPAELLDINAQGIVDHIDVTWNVANEVNLSHYELERSEDGASFEYVGDISGTGGPNSPQTYVYHDYDVRYFQDFYYRVRSVDLDGTDDYSPTVVASIVKKGDGFNENSVLLYPNPSFEDFYLSIFSEENMNLEMEVHNSLGQIVAQRSFVAQEGNTVINVPSNEWAPTVYYITLTDTISGKSINKRFIKENK